jgi:uncharacterized RDD family membrane protein YckC
VGVVGHQNRPHGIDFLIERNLFWKYRSSVSSGDLMMIHVARQGEKLGAYDLEDAKIRLRQGSLRENDLAWYEGAADWMPIVQVPGFQGFRLPPIPSSSLSLPRIPELPGAGSVFAGFWLRLVAFLIDVIILLIPKGLVDLMVFGTTSNEHGGADALSQIFYLGLDWVYFAALESSSWQGTIGKKILGLRVTDLAGERISFARASGRFFAQFVSTIILCIGYIMIAFTEKKQGLHDMMAGTIVTKKTI